MAPLIAILLLAEVLQQICDLKGRYPYVDEMTLSLWSMFDGLRFYWKKGPLVERVGYLVGVLLVLSGLVHLGILVISGGSWAGPLSLRKPATFGISFGLTLIMIGGIVLTARTADQKARSVLSHWCAVEKQRWFPRRHGAVCLTSISRLHSMG